MKRYSLVALFLFLLVAGLLSSCETIIDAKLDEGPAQLSVDGWITDQPGPQRIRLTETTAYFNNGQITPATNATVVVLDNDLNKLYYFNGPDKDGYYTWTPTSSRDTLGRIGHTYYLGIRYKGEEYYSASKLNRVPPIDSLIFRKEKINPLSSEYGYQAEFYATDLPGAADYYRVRYFRNGQLQNRPQDLIVAYDGAFNASGDTDGFVFIRPIRQSVNPENFFAMGDTVNVEVQSITPEAFYFFLQLREQITNGGLFATPPANVPTNILNRVSTGKKATGFFIASAVRTRMARVATENIREK